MIQSSPSRTARVRMPATSEPASGSVTAIADTRITSYNVCYTKLLRQQVADTVQDRLEAVQLCGVLPQLPGILPLLLGTGFRAFSVEATLLPYLWQTIADTRITSYNVCYTKLLRSL